MSGGRPAVLTIREAAGWLQTTVEALRSELEARRLRGFQVAGEWRITETALFEFMGEPGAQMGPGGKGGEVKGKKTGSVDEAMLRSVLAGSDWREAAAFSYSWPSTKGEPAQDEPYPQAYEAEVRVGERLVPLRIGFTERECAGMKDRKRAVVFLADGQLLPVVEFAGADDRQSVLLASIVKLPRQASGGHPHLRPGMETPSAYRVEGVDLCLYTEVVTGPYAASSMAVRVREDQYDVMAYHALVRALWKGWI